jgi:hypothetical protein
VGILTNYSLMEVVSTTDEAGHNDECHNGHSERVDLQPQAKTNAVSEPLQEDKGTLDATYVSAMCTNVPAETISCSLPVCSVKSPFPIIDRRPVPAGQSAPKGTPAMEQKQSLCHRLAV